MAGYAMGFDGGGAIPDDDQPQAAQSPAPAIDEGDADPGQNAEGPSTPAQPQQALDLSGDPDNDPNQDPYAPHKMLRNGTRRIIQYLMGADAAPPAVAQKFQTGVQHEYPDASPDDANVIAVHKAMELGGPDAAWAMVQFNRGAYNAKTAFARTALTGIPGKPADMNAVADAATQASQHVLDGSQAHFVADPSGNFTATVKMPGSDAAQSYMLTKPQMAAYLDIGKGGQWDRMMESGGVPAALTRAVRGVQQLNSPQAQGNTDPDADRRAQIQKRVGNWPVSDEDVQSGYDPETLARGYARFGHGVGQNAERNEWMSQQDAKADELQNKIDVENVKSGARVEGSRNKLEGTKYTADQRANAAQAQLDAKTQEAARKASQQAANMARMEGDANMREAGRNARKEIDALIMGGTATPEKIDAIMQKYHAPGMGQAAPPAAAQTPQAAAPKPQAQQGSSVPPANQRVTGQVYATPKGQFRWMGNGWQPAQGAQ